RCVRRRHAARTTSMARAPKIIRPNVRLSPMRAPDGVASRPKTPAAPMAVAETTIETTPRRRSRGAAGESSGTRAGAGETTATELLGTTVRGVADRGWVRSPLCHRPESFRGRTWDAPLAPSVDPGGVTFQSRLAAAVWGPERFPGRLLLRRPRV